MLREKENMYMLMREMNVEEAGRIREIDRSEHIESVFEFNQGQLIETTTGHQCPTWEEAEVIKLIERFKKELLSGGKAFGAFDGDRLVGFAVLAGTFRGCNKNRLQVDLMYVSNGYRRQGLGSKLLNLISEEAKSRGAEYLYISSTETTSAVNFYRNNGGEITQELDEELFKLEPKDIHMVRKL